MILSVNSSAKPPVRARSCSALMWSCPCRTISISYVSRPPKISFHCDLSEVENWKVGLPPLHLFHRAVTDPAAKPGPMSFTSCPCSFSAPTNLRKSFSSRMICWFLSFENSPMKCTPGMVVAAEGVRRHG
jgi:hypothetical protein